MSDAASLEKPALESLTNEVRRTCKRMKITTTAGCDEDAGDGCRAAR